jgi:hypothetical protein
MSKNKNLPRPQAEKPEPEKVEPSIEPIKDKPPLNPLTVGWVVDRDGFPCGGRMPEPPEDPWGSNIISPRIKRD